MSVARTVRVCIIYDADYPWDVRVEKVASTLVGNGCEVHLVCRNLAKRPTHEDVDGMHIHRIPAFKVDSINYVAGFPAFCNPIWLRTIARTVREHSVDLLMVRDLPLAPAALFVGRLCRVPVVIDMAENYPAMLRDEWRFGGFRPVNLVIRNPFVVDVVERLCVALADRIVTVTEEARARLLARYHVDESRVRIVSNTPRLSDRAAAKCLPPVRQSAPVLKLIYVGGLEPVRNLDVVLRGIALAARDLNCSLTIVGKGAGEESLRKLAENSGVAGKVVFRGWVPHGSVGTLLADSHIGIVPHAATDHTNTTVPNKLFDYMAQGLPVLASDTAPVRRIVESTRCGLIFRHDSPEEFLERLRQLADPNARAAFGANGRRAVEARYNWDVDSAELLAVVESSVPMRLDPTSPVRGGSSVPLSPSPDRP